MPYVERTSFQHRWYDANDLAEGMLVESNFGYTCIIVTDSVGENHAISLSNPKYKLRRQVRPLKDGEQVILTQQL
jgi:hypothetical protein